MSTRRICGAIRIANSAAAMAKAPSVAAGPSRPTEVAARVRTNRIATNRARPRLSTTRSVCIAAFHANAASGRPVGASVQPAERVR